MNTLTKAIASLTLCLVSVLAHAGSWSYVDASPREDTRLIGKLDDVEIYNEPAGRMATMETQLVTSGVYSGHAVAVIYVRDCARGNGPLSIVSVGTGDSAMFHWVKGGSRFYDSVGTTMCAALARRGIVR